MNSKPAGEQPSIEQVQERHQEELMALDGVVGVGSGLEERSGRTVLKVYVAQKTPALQDRIPSQLDGYPVQIEVTGEFNTLPV